MAILQIWWDMLPIGRYYSYYIINTIQWENFRNKHTYFMKKNTNYLI